MCLSIKRKIWIQFSSVLSEIIKEQNVFLVFTQWPLFWWKFFQLCFWNQSIKFSWINFRHRFILYNLLFIYEHADLFDFDLKKSSSGHSRGLLITHWVSNHALLCFILCIFIRLRLILKYIITNQLHSMLRKLAYGMLSIIKIENDRLFADGSRADTISLIAPLSSSQILDEIRLNLHGTLLFHWAKTQLKSPNKTKFIVRSLSLHICKRNHSTCESQNVYKAVSYTEWLWKKSKSKLAHVHSGELYHHHAQLDENFCKTFYSNYILPFDG